jgi:hypothetical protein
MPDQTTLAASPSPPSPDSKSSSQSEWSANTSVSTLRTPAGAGPSRSTPRTSPPSGARLSLSACLSIIFSGPCATGAALLVLVLVLSWCCVVLLAAACCWLLDPHSCSSPSPSGLSLVSAFSSFAAGKLPQLRRRGQAKRPRGHSPLEPSPRGVSDR